MENKKSLLNIYGISVILFGYSNTADKITSDFKYFLSKEETVSKNQIYININLQNPPYEKIPKVQASMYKTDCICYDYNNIRYADYNNKCLVIFDKDKRIADIFSLDEDMLYEISYLLLHSQAGELLDLNGFHRIHSCSFSYNKETFICILPQGGGKSTLLMNLLKNDDIKLLSDDTPITDRKGKIYPFPIRVGVCNDYDTSYIPSNFITTFNRRKFGQKRLIAFDYFKDKIENTDLPVNIIIGQRIYSDTPKIQTAGKFYIFKELFKSCVVGYGLPQVIEYFLIGGFKDFFKKIFIVLSRFYACIRLLLKTKQTFIFYLSKNTDANSNYFFDFFN
ncbi:MAG: hypothetical protein K5622_01090, partial [Endomicrobiaceae bacterium]|nr:hypothetical protein [Endomicrobiaceae bacterium]